MFKPVFTRLLMFALVWQALVWVLPSQQLATVQVIQNLTVHEQALDHHHHDDESTLHLDDASSGPGHHHAAESLQTQGMLMREPSWGVVDLPRVPPLGWRTEWRNAWLRGPLKPPQA